MIKYQKISGIKIDPKSTLKKIEATPEGKAMGAIPGWSLFLDPNYASETQNWVRNRALPSTVSRARTGTVSVGEFPGGQKGLVATDEAPFNTICKTVINPNECSGFVVAKFEEGATNALRVIRAEPSLHGWGVHFGANLAGTELRFWDSTDNSPGAAGVALGGELNPNLLERDSPSLVMFTFSTSRGLALYDNGVEVARDAGLNQPFESGIGEADVVVYQNSRGLLGIAGLINLDLSAPEHTGYRRSIEQFLMTKYGISA